MRRKKEYQASQIETYQEPEWFTEALRATRDAAYFVNPVIEPEQISLSFRERCRKAAEVALILETLRRERRRVGFVPLSLANYIEGLAKVTNVSLTPVLLWLGITDLAGFDHGSVKALARLAKDIEISIRETLVHLRISFADRFGLAPISL